LSGSIAVPDRNQTLLLYVFETHMLEPRP